MAKSLLCNMLRERAGTIGGDVKELAGNQNNLGPEVNCKRLGFLMNNMERHLRVLIKEVKYSDMF